MARLITKSSEEARHAMQTDFTSCPGGPAIMAPRLLQTIDDIDGDWVRSALIAKYPEIPEITNVAFKPIGNGNANDTYKVMLDYAETPCAAPASVVLKVHSSIPETAQAAADAGGYRCEHEMTRILPRISGMAVPEFYFSAVTDDNRRSNILMQDLSSFCEPGDQMKGASSAQAIAAVEELLKLHKHFWNAPDLDTFEWTVDAAPFHRQGHPVIKERLGTKLSDEEVQIIDDSIRHIDAWLADTPTNRTLIHADCRVDNILFDMTDAEAPKAYIIDWANCRAGDAMADITYLLASSVSRDERPACEQKAIALFAHEIAKIDPTYSVQQATEDYRRNITSSMFLTLLAAAFIPQTPHTDLLLETLIRRNCAAHKDWLFS